MAFLRDRTLSVRHMDYGILQCSGLFGDIRNNSAFVCFSGDVEANGGGHPVVDRCVKGDALLLAVISPALVGGKRRVCVPAPLAVVSPALVGGEDCAVVFSLLLLLCLASSVVDCTSAFSLLLLLLI